MAERPEQFEGSDSFESSSHSECCLAKIHVVPRVSTWKEVTVAQAPWLPVRRLESPLEPDLTLLSLVIGTNSPCAVSLRLALPQNCWKGISDWTKLSRSLQPSEVGISLFAKPRDGGKLSPSHPRCLLRPSFSSGRRRYTRESPNNIQLCREAGAGTGRDGLSTRAARTATTLGRRSWCTEYVPNSWI